VLREKIVRLMKAITTCGWISGYLPKMVERVPFISITARSWVALIIHYQSVRVRVRNRVRVMVELWLELGLG
jgi:hypothetical protein